MDAPSRPVSDETRRRLRPWLLAALALALFAGVVAALALLVEPARPGRLFLSVADGSVDAFLSAVRALGDRLARIDFPALGAALVLSSCNVIVRSLAWRNIIAAAYPLGTVRWRHALGASYVGIGVNAVLPARLGDPLKVILAHRRVEGSTYPTLASTLIAETLFDAAVGGCLLVWAWQANLLPAPPQLPRLPLFEISWYAQRPWILAAVGGVSLVILLVVQSRVRAFWARVRQGLVILTQPLRYAREVAVHQALGWACRVGAAYFFLDAFGVEATLRNALLVQVASSLATLVPATPGGLGPRQALYVVLLSGSASRQTLLAFGVGTGLALAAWNALLGFVALTLTLRGTGVRRLLAQARERASST